MLGQRPLITPQEYKRLTVVIPKIIGVRVARVNNSERGSNGSVLKLNGSQGALHNNMDVMNAYMDGPMTI